LLQVMVRAENKLDQFLAAGVNKRVFRHAVSLRHLSLDSKGDTIQKETKCLLTELVVIG
jgi:hypothetical protein